MIHLPKEKIAQVWEQIPQQNRMQLAKCLFFLAHKKVGGIRHERQQSGEDVVKIRILKSDSIAY